MKQTPNGFTRLAIKPKNKNKQTTSKSNSYGKFQYPLNQPLPNLGLSQTHSSMGATILSSDSALFLNVSSISADEFDSADELPELLLTSSTELGLIERLELRVKRSANPTSGDGDPLLHLVCFRWVLNPLRLVYFLLQVPHV